MMQYLLEINLTVMVLISLFFFIWFEKDKPGPEEILPIVVIATAASLGRVIFAIIPQVQPVTALVIIMGSIYGAKTGYMTGALSALISNMMLGQGPWTPFQMAAWGLVGVVASAIKTVLPVKSEQAWRIIYTIYGFLSAYLYSFLTDFLTICYLGEGVTMESVFAVYLSGFAFAIGHAIGNAILIFLFYGILSRKLCRVKQRLA